jgi:hypothetical protein
MTPPLEKILTKGAKHEWELRRLQSIDGRLSAKGHISDALAQPGANAKEVAAFEKALQDPAWSVLRQPLGNLVTTILEFSATSCIREPYLSRMYLKDALSPLARLGVSLASANVLAAKLATERKPEHFGVPDSPAALREAIAAAMKSRDEFAAEIERSWTRDDVTIHRDEWQVHADRRSLITFKCTLDQVELSDGRDLGARLISWWADNVAEDGRKPSGMLAELGGLLRRPRESAPLVA